MDCSQAFSVEKTSKDGLLRSVFAGFLLNWCAVFHLSIVKKSDTSYQTVYYWAYKKETCHLLCFLIKVLPSVFPLISSALSKNTLMIYR